MTKDEILALIDSAITGQGTNVDGGGQLATILKGIVDAIPEPPVDNSLKPYLLPYDSFASIPDAWTPFDAKKYNAIKSAVAIETKDGEIFPTRFAPGNWEAVVKPEEGKYIFAAFGDLYATDLMEGCDLIAFEVEFDSAGNPLFYIKKHIV